MHIYTTSKNFFSVCKKVRKQAIILFSFFILGTHAFAQIPLNDDPCLDPNFPGTGAIALTPTAACSYSTFSNVDASNSATTGIPTPTCGTFSDGDVWFTVVVPPNATSIVIDTRSGPAAGPTQPAMANGALAAYTATGTCPNLTMTQIGCNDNNGGNLMPQLTLTAAPGTLIYIRMWGVGGQVGTFGICVTANIPPANDECTGAQSLTVNPDLLCGTVTPGTTNNATQSATTPTPTCGTVNGWNDDVWYSFVATAVSHRVSLLNVTGTSTAMVINMYSGTCAALTSIGCIAGNTLDVGSLTIGNTYYVRVYTNVTTTTATANFNICIGTPPPPPVNDECINATVLTVNPDYACGVVTAGTTVSATQSNTLPTPTCTATNGWNDDVWYSFVATNTAHRVSFSNVAGTTDMATSVYSGTCGNLVQIACIDFPDPNIINLTGLTVGNTYYVRTQTWTATVGSTATFNICVGTPPPPPANDNCVNATNVTVNPNYLCGSVTPGTIVSATPTLIAPTPSCNAAGADDDVWFKFVATNPIHRINLTNVVGTTTAMTSVIYSGTCSDLIEVNCNTTNLYNVSGLTVGATYYLRVFTTTATPAQEVSFNVCIGTPPPPPSNDECTGAIALTVNPNQLCGTTTIGSTAGATQSTTLPTPTCSPLNGWDDDVWYSFVAVSNNHTVSLQNVNGTTTNMATSVYSGTCGNLTQIACATADPNLINLSTLTPGQTYYVRVQTELANGGDATFNICVGTPGPGSVCSNGNPFCSTSGVVYPSVTGQPSLGQIDCLFTTPNPTWFSFQVSSPGNLVFQVSQTNTAGVGIDVDYAAWGPFTSQAAGCASVEANPVPTVSCSYSAAAIETITIPNAQVGQWYIVLITNFNGGAGTISFNTTTGNVGSTNCNIVCNTTAANNGPVCNGGTFNLTSTAITGSSFSWTGPGGFTSTAQNPLNVVAPTTAGTYTYNVTANVGAVACPASTIVIVTAPPPAPTVTTPLTYCQNANASALTATTSSPTNTLLFYTVAIGGTGVASLIPSTATIGSTTYYVSQKAGNCESPRVAIVVNVVSSTTPSPSVISPINYCQGATATSLSGNATGTNVLWYNTPTGSIGSSTAPTPSTTASGSTIYYVSQTIGTCESPKVQVMVNVTPYSPTPTGATPVNYCQAATSIPLTSTGTNLLWYTVSTGGIGSSTAPTPNTSTVGSSTYYVTQTSNGCQSLQFAITVNILANPAAPTVVSPLTYCQGAVAPQLTATSSSTLTWYATATATTGTATAPTPSTAAVGSTTYYVGASNGTCQSPLSSILVNINAASPAPTVSPTVTYCQGATATALTATGTNILWYSAPTGGTGSATAPTPSTTASGSTTYYVTQTTGICESPRTPIVVNVTPYSPTPTGTTPVNYCQGATSVPLSATGTNLLWYTVPTGGTGSSTAPTPNTSVAGTTTYYVTQTSNGCQSLQFAIAVNVTANPPAPTVVSPLTYCQGTVAPQLTATSSSTLTWYATATAPTGTATAPTPSTATVGSTTYYVGAANGTCQSPRSSITVNINATPAAPTVTPTVTYCQGATATALTATGTNILWYSTPTGGTGSTTASTPSTTTVGTTTYYVSSTIGTCEGPRSSITVTVNATPVAPTVVTPVTYCQSATAAPLTATGTGLLWYTTPTLGTGSATAPTPSTATGGSTTYYVSSTLGTCEGPRSAITVTVTATPAAPTVTTPVKYCQADVATALTATGSSLLWYTVPTGGTSNSTAPTPSTVNAGNTSYYVTQSTSGVVCESPRALIVVTVNPKPIAPSVVSPIPYCQNVNAIALTATGAAGNTFLWYNASAGGTGTATATIPSTASVGSTTYYVSQVTSALCEGPRSGITVNISPALTVNAGNDTIMARGNSVQLNGSSTGIVLPNVPVYLWTSNILPLSLSSATIPNPIANPIFTTKYTLKVTDPTGLCPSVSDDMILTVVQSCINVRNAFTPNGDGINDKWFVYDQNFCLANPGGCKVNVFNRYGSRVFESKDYANTWEGIYNGKALPDGTYYAVIEFILFDGSKQVVRTDVTILR